MTANEVVEIPAATESTHVVRRRVFQISGMRALPALLARLKHEQFTGSVTVHVSQGAANAAHTEEIQKLRG